MATSGGKDNRVVRLVCTVKGEPEEKFPLTFEVTLDKDLIARGRAYFGFQGLLSGELYPFVLYPDGRLDFGSGYDDDDRYTSSNILDKAIERGAIFTTRERDPDTDRVREYVYVIKQIVTL